MRRSGGTGHAGAWALAALLCLGLLLLAEFAAAQRGPCVRVPETSAYALALVAIAAFVFSSLPRPGSFGRTLAQVLAFGGLLAAGAAWGLPPFFC